MLLLILILIRICNCNVLRSISISEEVNVDLKNQEIFHLMTLFSRIFTLEHGETLYRGMEVRFPL